jgi:hypothetical protein
MKTKPLIKSKLTKDGDRLVQVLQNEYFMDRSAAIRLLHDGGAMLAVALLTRGKR